MTRPVTRDPFVQRHGGRPDASVAAVEGWRRRTLLRAGFEGPLAARLAADPHVDLHAVLKLVDAGCPPVLAARITAPIDEEERR